MSKAERTRQHIIEKTAAVFNRKGFAGTSLSDITETTGLTKGALYGHFESKDDIATEAFRYAMKKVREKVQQRILPATSFKEQLTNLAEFYSEYVFDPPVAGGCPLLNASVEVDDDHPSMRRVVVKELLQTVNFIQSLVEKGMGANEFKSDVDAKRVAYTFFCIIEGAIMFSRAEQSREPMDIAVAHCKQLLNQISNHNNNEQTA